MTFRIRAAREALGSAAARNHAQLQFGQAELRRLPGHDDVAHQRRLETAAQGIAAHGRYDGLGAGRYSVRHLVLVQVALHLAHDADLGALLDVGACGKGLGIAGEDDAAHLRVGIECGDRMVQTQWAFNSKASSQQVNRFYINRTSKKFIIPQENKNTLYVRKCLHRKSREISEYAD